MYIESSNCQWKWICSQGWDHRFFRWGETPNSRCSTTTTSTMTAPGQLGLSSTFSDLIILTKLYWAGRLATWMQKLVFILTPWTSNLFRLNHSTNKHDSVHILRRVYCFKKQNVDSNNFSWLRIVRSHLVPPAAILDSGSNPCSIWKVSLAYLGIKHSFFFTFP